MDGEYSGRGEEYRDEGEEYGGGGEEYSGGGEEYSGGGEEYRGGGITFTLKTDHEEIKTEDIEGFEDTSQAILIATQGIFSFLVFFIMKSLTSLS